MDLEDLRQHREARDRRLLSPDGWLAIVGRWVLEEGDNAVDGGVAILHDGAVLLRVDGHEQSWPAGATKPQLVIGERRWEVLRQGPKVAVRVRDPRSPALASFAGVDRYAPDARFCVDAQLTGAAKIITMQVGLGVDVDYPCPGTLTFSIDGRAVTVDPVIEDGELFILFRDGTNTKTTYGAGRFLYAKLPDERGHVVVDFNKAFNPPCALTDFASCPIAPPQNRLPLDVTAGEKYPVLHR